MIARASWRHESVFQSGPSARKKRAERPGDDDLDKIKVMGFGHILG